MICEIVLPWQSDRYVKSKSVELIIQKIKPLFKLKFIFVWFYIGYKDNYKFLYGDLHYVYVMVPL